MRSDEQYCITVRSVIYILLSFTEIIHQLSHLPVTLFSSKFVSVYVVKRAHKLVIAYFRLVQNYHSVSVLNSTRNIFFFLHRHPSVRKYKSYERVTFTIAQDSWKYKNTTPSVLPLYTNRYTCILYLHILLCIIML